jgi:acyl-CoA:acyl-CoA alkyltransferase
MSTFHFEHVSVLSLASVDAPIRVASASLEARLAKTLTRLGFARDIVTSLTGIVERRVWEQGTTPSQAATRAAERALETARVERSRIGVLISTSVCKDYIEPSVAALVHGNLALGSHCQNFDIGNACLAFLTGMQVAGTMIERGHLDYALIVDGESSRNVVESTLARLESPACDARMFKDSIATLTLGSGAAAMVLARRDLAPRAPRMVSVVSRAATEHRHLCRGQVDGMVTDAGGLLAAGVALAAATWSEGCRDLGWDGAAFDELVLHQVSAVHTAKLLERLELDARKVLPIFPEFGNIGPASIPIVLAKAVEAGRVRAGNRIALMGIGSGLNCSMMELVW